MHECYQSFSLGLFILAVPHLVCFLFYSRHNSEILNSVKDNRNKRNSLIGSKNAVNLLKKYFDVRQTEFEAR